MSGGRTVWWPKDCGWWDREWIVELGEEFGPTGPAVIDWLSCKAKLQNEGGSVSAGLRTVARGCFAELVTVGHVVSRAVAIGLLEDYEERGSRFTCRISGWDADNSRGTATWRKQDERTRRGPVEPDTDETHGDDPGHGGTDSDLSRSVTLREEKRREEVKQQTTSVAAGRRPVRRAEQGEPPANFPDRLREALEQVHPIVAAIQSERGGALPTVRGIGLQIRTHPDRDHIAVARELEHWALAGNGQNQEVRDWARKFGAFLKHAAVGAPSRSARRPLRDAATIRREEEEANCVVAEMAEANGGVAV